MNETTQWKKGRWSEGKRVRWVNEGKINVNENILS